MYFQSEAMKDVAKQNPALPTNKYINKEKRQACLSVFCLIYFQSEAIKDVAKQNPALPHNV